MFKLVEILTILNHCIYEVSEKVKENLDREIVKISIDTRKDCKDSLFIPLKGENFDAHGFIEKAFEKGAIASLTERDVGLDEKLIIKVKECLFSLGELAKAYIEREGIKTIAITGSSGKTTVKEILAYLTEFPAPEKSFNNLIGVPLTILEKGEKDKFLILEFGTNIKGEISRLTQIGMPEYVIITNIDYAHLQGFGSFENYIDEKLSILESIKLKKAIINMDNPELNKKINNNSKNIIKYSASQIKEFNQTIEGANYLIEINGKKYRVISKLPGFHNAVNFLGAITLLNELNFNLEEMIEKFENFSGVNMRFQVINKNEIKIINDCYNANFSSFKSAIETLNNLDIKGKKILVAGDMLELGDYSKKIHKKLGKVISNSDIDVVVCIGEEIRETFSNINKVEKKLFSSKDNALEYLQRIIEPNDVVLFKASRKLKFEDMIENLQ